ncbi:MAG: hypothetical protein ACRECH_09765 [Nitrososphaerales archaeon]
MNQKKSRRFSNWKESVVHDYKRKSERDKRWLMKLNVEFLNKLLWPLYVAFVCLNFLDIYSTALAMTSGPAFYELNRFAAALFRLNFTGYLIAVALKFMPEVPLFYAVFSKDPRNEHQVQIRAVKYAALVALIAGDLIYLYIVGVNNLPILLSGVSNGSIK